MHIHLFSLTLCLTNSVSKNKINFSKNDLGSSLGTGLGVGEMKAKQHNNKNTLQRVAKKHNSGFPGGAVVENLPANAGYTGSSPGLGRSHMPRSN